MDRTAPGRKAPPARVDNDGHRPKRPPVAGKAPLPLPRKKSRQGETIPSLDHTSEESSRSGDDSDDYLGPEEEKKPTHLTPEMFDHLWHEFESQSENFANCKVLFSQQRVQIEKMTTEKDINLKVSIILL